MIGITMLAGLIFLVVIFQRSDKEMADHLMPQLLLAQIHIVNFSAERADMKMDITIDNPAPIGLNIDSLYYIISIEGNELIETTYPDSLQIDANDSTTFSLPLTVYYDKLKSVLDKLEQEGRDSVVYKINATIYADTKIIPKDEFNLEVEKLLPLIRTPGIDVMDLSVEDLKFSGATVVIEALIENKSLFSYSFEDIHYNMQIEDNEMLEGNKPGIINIPAKDTAIITIPVAIDFKETGRSLVDLIRKGNDLSYDFRLTTEIVSDEHVLEESEIILHVTGKLKNLADVVKEQAKEN